VLIELIIMILLTLAFDWLPVRLKLVPQRIRHARARQLARLEFAAHNGGDPSQRRILLFISLGERYVQIIADRTTHALAAEAVWNKIVAEFLASVKSGRIADGVVVAIEACGAVLAAYHPPTGNDEAARQ
jgi:putative membrane protein